MRKKLKIEYSLNPTPGIILWNAISTPAGLERWFADKVTRNGKVFTFHWGKTETRDAEITNFRSESFIKFHWKDDDDPKSFFEFKILYNDLTADNILEITDCVGPEDEDDTVNLWNSQIDVLKRVFGL